MRILYIYGDDDYHANIFEGGPLSVEEVASLCQENGGSYSYVNPDDECESYEAELLTFGDIDINFIKWVKYNQDYDVGKHSNFYPVDEK